MNPKPAFYQSGQPFTGPDTIALMKEVIGNRPVILSFSCGKDSIGLWLALRPHFEVIPFYMYVIPDLDFVEASLNYYEGFFGCHILRLPHPSFYRMLNNFTFQPPDRVAYIRACDLPNFSYDDLSMLIANQHGLEDAWTATGIRTADSPNRRSSINSHGPVNWRRRYFYPIWDMRLDPLIELLETNQVKLPVDYRLFGRSFDGIDHRFLSVIKREFPADYAKILEWFPLAEVELKRYEIGVTR
jgi:hypothetical protein